LLKHFAHAFAAGKAPRDIVRRQPLGFHRHDVGMVQRDVEVCVINKGLFVDAHLEVVVRRL
jgi:hypothetical protein